MKIYNPKLILVTFMAVLLSACGASDDKSAETSPEETVVEETPAPTQVEEDKTDAPVEEVEVEETTPDTDVDIVKVIDLTNQVPGKLKISTDGSAVSLSWSAIRGAQSYNVYYNEADHVGTGDTMFVSATNSFTHQNLDQTAHSYKVQAVYATSLSDLSQQMLTNLSHYSTPVEDSSSQ